MAALSSPAELRELAKVWEAGAVQIEQEFVPTKPDFQQYADRDRRVAQTLLYVAQKIEDDNG